MHYLMPTDIIIIEATLSLKINNLFQEIDMVLFTMADLFIWKVESESDIERFSIHWFTAQMPQQPVLCQTKARSQEARSPKWVVGV